MDAMAYYNDNYFAINFNKYHENDSSLVCHNNILYYNGDEKVIYGSIKVQPNERVSLNKYRLSNLNVNQWMMDAHQLFFYIRESVKLLDVNIDKNIIDIYQMASKRFIDETEKFSLTYLVDYYNSLKTIEPNLSDDLFEAFKKIKNVFAEVKTMTSSNITPGFRLIYEKIFGDIKESESESSSNSESNSRGIQRTNSTIPKVHHSDNNEFNEAAFISVCALIILILALVIGTMTYIFS